MATTVRILSLGWGNQPRVSLHPGGALVAPGVAPPPTGSAAPDDVLAAGDGLYRTAVIVNDQVRSPFSEARASLSLLQETVAWIGGVSALCGPGATLPAGLTELQARQLRASAGVVILSIVESQKGRKGKDAIALVRKAMEGYLARLEAESEPLLQERLAMNLDWIIPSLPAELAGQAKSAMNRHLQWSPPYAAWFAKGETLRVDWKCGSEFLEGWCKRLAKDGFTRTVDGGSWGASVFTRTYKVAGKQTEVVLNLGPERSDVFAKMNDPATHIVGYDGHSDWGRKIPRSLYRAPAQEGEKAIFYLLCCGKQVLEKVRDTYPRAHVVTTFNSSKFTTDFTYSEDYSAFLHILDGISRRETWDQIRQRVNSSWYDNPEKNYLFPGEPLVTARALDSDHDGQADVFDRLIDFNTFDVPTDALEEFSPRVPETPPRQIVGTKLHLGVQVFHTLAHFNQVLESFTHELRVFAGGWYDPTEPAGEDVIEHGPTRVRVEKKDSSLIYRFQGSCHFAHASEETWRALCAVTLATVVMGREPQYRSMAPEDRVLTGLLLVAHGLEVDDSLGRDRAIWNHLLPALGLPLTLSLEEFQAAKRVEEHWYAGCKASITKLRKELAPEVLAALKTWAAGKPAGAA